MLISKSDSNFLFIPKDIWTKYQDSLYRVREVWSKIDGQLVQVYGGNVTNYTGNHPYWRHSLNSEFIHEDGAVPCWNTFFSTNNAGGYLLNPSAGTMQVQIPLAAMTQTEVPGTPGSPGYYNYTTENASMFVNTTNGSSTAITFVGSPPDPLTRTDLETGATVRWTCLNTGPPNPFNPTGNPTRIQAVSTSGQVNTLTLSRNAVATANAYAAGLTRTWASEFVDGTAATEGYTQYVGFCNLQSNYEIRISQNTSYSITVMPTAGTTTNTTWKIGCLTGSNGDGSAQFFAPGSAAFESPAYTTTTQSRTLTFTSPAGANRARPYIRIDYDSGADGLATTLPRQYTFEYVRFA